MSSRHFIWDPAKNLSNQRKHGVSFEQAAYIFTDPFHMSVPDRIVDGEQRWQTIGTVGGIVLLLVAHTVVDGSDGRESIRIISARKATRKERTRYEDI